MVDVTTVKGITGTAEVLLDYALSNSVAFHRHGGGPCRCFEVKRWKEGGAVPPARVNDGENEIHWFRWPVCSPSRLTSSSKYLVGRSSSVNPIGRLPVLSMFS